MAPPDTTRALVAAALAGDDAARLAPALSAVAGPRAGARIAIRDGLVAGRGRRADLRLPDVLASRAHARFARAGDAWRVHDLGSKNGLTVNGRPAAPDGTALAPGDLVALGASVLRFEAPRPAPGGGPAAGGAAGPAASPAAGRAPLPATALALGLAALLLLAAALG